MQAKVKTVRPKKKLATHHRPIKKTDEHVLEVAYRGRPGGPVDLDQSITSLVRMAPINTEFIPLAPADKRTMFWKFATKELAEAAAFRVINSGLPCKRTKVYKSERAPTSGEWVSIGNIDARLEDNGYVHIRMKNEGKPNHSFVAFNKDGLTKMLALYGGKP